MLHPFHFLSLCFLIFFYESRSKSTTIQTTEFFESTLFLFNLTKENEENDFLASITSQLYIDAKICSTFEFAVPLVKVFLILVSALRLFTLVVNLFTSVAYHLQFRKEYINALKNMFKKGKHRYNNNKYSARQSCGSNEIALANGEAAKQHEFGVTRAFRFSSFAFIYSTREPIVTDGLDNTIKEVASDANSEREKREASLKAYFYQLHFNHFHFVRHYALMIFVYTILIAPSVFDENRKSFEELRQFVSGGQHSKSILNIIKNINNEPLVNHQTAVFQLTMCLAHSIKFFVYIIFSAHVNFYFECFKNKPKSTARKDLTDEII